MLTMVYPDSTAERWWSLDAGEGRGNARAPRGDRQRADCAADLGSFRHGAVVAPIIDQEPNPDPARGWGTSRAFGGPRRGDRDRAGRQATLF
jgi:hypothetical protein